MIARYRNFLLPYNDMAITEILSCPYADVTHSLVGASPGGVVISIGYTFPDDFEDPAETRSFKLHGLRTISKTVSEDGYPEIIMELSSSKDVEIVMDKMIFNKELGAFHHIRYTVLPDGEDPLGLYSE